MFGNPCKGDTRGLLKRCPVTASGVRLIGKETERGWEQDDDISTLLPSLLRCESDSIAGEQIRQRLLRIPLDLLERDTGLSPHTLIRARQGKRVHARTLKLLTRTALTGCKRGHSGQKPSRFFLADWPGRIQLGGAYWARDPQVWRALQRIRSAANSAWPSVPSRIMKCPSSCPTPHSAVSRSASTWEER